MGTAIALAMAEAGADVATITNVSDHAADTVERVQNLGRRAASAVLDVTDEAALVNGIGELSAQLGPIRHLVNVIGGGSSPGDLWPAETYDMATFDRVTALNVRYAIVSCREVAGALIQSHLSGSVVSISSGAVRGLPLRGAYAASKAALESFSRTMALEWGKHSIRVNVVRCGRISTPRAPGTAPEEDWARHAVPLGRLGKTSEVADATLFLLSDLSSYITGHTLTVDGGQSMSLPENPVYGQPSTGI
jgi:NAD(P)-dependent dehydrogenase (short-subunit alcohol dehydrogenase family)